MAKVYRDQGRYADAEPLFLRAVEIYEKTLGPDDTEFALLLISLTSSSLRGHRTALPARLRIQGHLSNFLIASALTGVKKLTRLPSGSRNNSERLPHGIVVGS
jgi:hypothetical protein